MGSQICLTMLGFLNMPGFELQYEGLVILGGCGKMVHYRRKKSKYLETGVKILVTGVAETAVGKILDGSTARLMTDSRAEGKSKLIIGDRA